MATYRRTMTNDTHGLDDETKRELEQAAKEREEEKKREERRRRREGTKYGGMLNDE